MDPSNDEKMYAKQALIAGCLATVLVSIGTFTPGWTVISGTEWGQLLYNKESNYSVTSIGLGLWFQQICTSDECITSSYPSQMYAGVDMNGITEFRICTCFGIIFSVSACVMTGLHLQEKNQRLTGVAASLMFLFAGITTWLPSGKMIHRYVIFNDYFDDLGISGNPLKFPYSTIVCGVGGILDWFCVFLVSYNVWKIWNYSKEFQHKRMEMNTYI